LLLQSTLLTTLPTNSLMTSKWPSGQPRSCQSCIQEWAYFLRG